MFKTLGGIKMNKTELIKAVAGAANLTQKDAEAAINAFADVVIAEVKKGDKVVLQGFGTFEARGRAAREGINPKTGAKIKIAAKKVPAFSAGGAFKDAVNK
jgi:DNA-binding protein HU-beta